MSGRHAKPQTTEQQHKGVKRRHKDQDEGYVEGPCEMPTGKIFILVLALAALIVGLYIQVAKNLSDALGKPPMPGSPGWPGETSAPAGRRDYQTLVVADNMNAGYLDHIVDGLLKFGHRLSFSGSLTAKTAQESNLAGFNLIWMHDYPFQTIKRLHPRQRINHFPGTGFITNKMTLSTTPRLPHLLRAFRLPQERERFIEFASNKQSQWSDNSSELLWIRKGAGHRGISVETLEGVLAAPSSASDGSDVLVQEYMSNPLLIDGKKFDIGVYAVLTSVEPLRIYVYESEALLRFCAQPYLEPASGRFNATKLDSFVVGDDYTPIWLMPSLLRHYIGANLSMKQSLNVYLRSLGRSADGIWNQIEETIKHVYKSKEHHLARMSRLFQEANNYNGSSVSGSLGQFFEMVRFDFILDDRLQVYLMEANMSPNLSSRHFPPNRLLYEQVLSSYFSLVGLGELARQHLATNVPIHYLDGQVELPAPGGPTRSAVSSSASDHQAAARYGLDELVSEKELAVYEDLCVSDECHMNCQKVDCRLCYFCLSYPDKLHLRRAIFEHHSRWNFKRLMPSTRDQDLELQLSHPDRLGEGGAGGELDANYFHVQWFRGKCLTDSRFCSY